MNRVFTFAVNKHQDIMRYFIILLSVLVISWFFPKSGIFKYEFEVGKPWKYETLLAPFDFGIQKTAEELKDEKDRILKDFAPYYVRDMEVVQRRKQQFVKAVSDAYMAAYDTIPLINLKDSTRNIRFGLQVLDEIYEKGVIQVPENHQQEGQRFSLMGGNNIVEIKRLNELLTLKQAFGIVRRDLKNTTGIFVGIIGTPLENAVGYNITYSDSLTQKFRSQLIEDISFTRGLVQDQEEIIRTGAIVTEEKYRILSSFKLEYERRIIGAKKSQLIFLGNVILTSLVLIILTFFILTFSPKVYESNRKMLFIFMLITGMVVLVSSLVQTDLPILYAIPFCILPIILRTFFGARLALHVHIALVLLSSFIVPMGVEYAFLQILAGMVAIFTNIKAYNWTQFFVANVFILLTYDVGYFAISIIQEGALQNINWLNFGWLALNVLLLFLAYPLIPFFERIFGFVSEITLIELSDINKPLLKDLSIKAPGTFQHSLQVANLAEAAAFEIGANTLLVKVGALYHDIGKMEKPGYFIENQKHDTNPHDDLSAEESAAIIVRHVTKGVEMAKKQKLPDILIDFIRTHHGTSRTEYFYRQYKKQHPDEEIKDDLFRYPGPLPYSKETALVMMADVVEAASRSLKNPTDQDINKLVEKLIHHKIEENQFINSNITFKEITTTKKVLKKMLHSIYHVRVAYPESE